MKIMIADHRPFVRTGLTAMLSKEPEFQVVGEDETEIQILEGVKRHSPDLIISNWRFGTSSGLELIRNARGVGYEGKVLLLAEHVSKQEFAQAKALQIGGLIANTAIQEEFIHALNLLRMGKRYYDSNLFDSFLIKSAENLPKSDLLLQLTEKELEVLQTLGQGLSNRQIAQTLFVSEYTVKKHVSQVLSKLELADRYKCQLKNVHFCLFKHVQNLLFFFFEVIFNSIGLTYDANDRCVVEYAI